MLELLFQGFVSVFDPSRIFIIGLGVIIGLIMGALPGIGGMITLAVLLPFSYGMEPLLAISFLVGAHAVVYTGGSVSAILLNTPGTGPNAATLFDGYPMTKQGQGGRAIGAAVTSSMIGGVVGAVILALLIPVVRPIVLSFGPPEFFMLVLLGISFIAILGEGSLISGFISGGFGLLLSLIGFDPITGDVRYTFGSLYLYDGVNLVPLTLGLFAIPEMINLAIKKGTIAQTPESAAKTGVLEGIKDAFRHWWLVVRCSTLGTIIGMIPGLGGDVACFLSYGHARQTSKYPEKFGNGSVEGVIAPESANNAKEGGAFLPTFGFGIPGSAAMAIMLAAFLIAGIVPGPEMLKGNVHIVFAVVATLVVANILGGIITLGFANTLAKIVYVRVQLIIPIVLVLIATGAYVTSNNIWDVIFAFIFGISGYAMMVFKYPRPVFLIGFILGEIAEVQYHMSLQLYGPIFFLIRPIALVILVIIIATLFFSLKPKNIKVEE